MATPTMKQILEQTRQLIAVKEAEFKTNLAGGVKTAKGLDTAGAGDDSPITRGQALEAGQPALEPQKKPALSSDANAEPPSDGKGTKKEKSPGQNEGNETDRSNALESGDPAPVSLSKKPAITADANAKVADSSAKIANSIISSIREYQSSTKSAEVMAGKGEPVKPSEAPEAKKIDAKEKSEGARGKEIKKEENKAEAKQADGPQMELTSDVLSKIAAMVLSTEEGAEFVEGVLAKAAGAEAAQETLMFLAQQSELAEKQAAYEAGARDAEALIQQAIYAQGVAAGQKQASAQGEQDFFAKLGQQAADASIESLMSQGQGAGSAAGGAGGDLAAGGGLPTGGEGGEGGGEQGISPEELMQGLEQLVQEGTLKPEEAQAVMEYIQQAEGGGAEGGAPEAGGASGAPAAGGAGEEAAGHEAGETPAEEKKEEAAKAAAVKPTEKAAALLETIRQIRQSRG